MDHPQIIAFGNLITDWLVQLPHLPVNPAEHQTLSELRCEPGGMANFLIAGQRLGAQMVAQDTLGEDDFSDRLLSLLAAEGVQTDSVHRLPGLRSRAVVVLADAADGHTYLPFPGGEIPKQEYPPAWAEELQGAQALYLEGFTLDQPAFHDSVMEAAAKAAKIGVPVFFDPGPRRPWVDRDFMRSLYGVFLNEQELLDWTGLSDIEGAWSLLEDGARLVVLKQGAQGSRIITSNLDLACPAFTVPVVDSMGAGDVFNAAFLVKYLHKASLADCGRLANAAGASMVGKVGAGRQAPTLAEIAKILRNPL
jgi:sugar/nucleoside kinase (ribokinase family)